MRYEYKYYVPYTDLPMLRDMILPFVNPDKHAVGRPENTYTVRSIYYDTPHLIFYKEKVEGLRFRKKVRIRGYNREEDNNIVFMEIKRKIEIPLRKNRVPVSFQEAQDLIAGKIEIEDLNLNLKKFPYAQDDARKFLYHYYGRNLRPVVLVIYEREPYLSKTDPTIRVTFDKHLRSAAFPRLADLYNEKGIRYAFKDKFILEVKFNDHYPAWMKPLIGYLGVRQKSASKYVISMDNHRIATYSPERILSITREKADPPKNNNPQLLTS
jgi:hypothetical protein